MNQVDICLDEVILEKLVLNLDLTLGVYRELLIFIIKETGSFIFGKFILDSSIYVTPTRLDIVTTKESYRHLMKILNTFAKLEDFVISDSEYVDYVLEYITENLEIYLHITRDKIMFMMNLDYTIEMIWYDGYIIVGYQIHDTFRFQKGVLTNPIKIFTGNEEEITKFHKYMHQGYTICLPKQVFDFSNFKVPYRDLNSIRERKKAILEDIITKDGFSRLHDLILNGVMILYDSEEPINLGELTAIKNDIMNTS